ncbi:MAG: hypothetical protein KDK38_14870 [Leptospiraceae bacterium]|nr:hypothetical protein [Leptospiraceae bacterium]
MNKLLFFILSMLILVSCKKEPEPLFELNEFELYPTAAGKDKLKSNQQFIAILHANLFQTTLSANDLFDANECIESIGDKELAREVIISNFMNKDGVVMPTPEEMNADLDQFITDTYIRFLVRYPTESEKTFVANFITSNPYMSPELVYFSFALSNEYMFY